MHELLTEEQYQAIKQNPWIDHFIELPPKLSYPGHRRGFIVFSIVTSIRPKLIKLLKWYEDKKNSMDPVELAAKFQQSFISIHPFVDGNGRTSRFLMDRILAEHSLPPSIIDDQNDDIFKTSEYFSSTKSMTVFFKPSHFLFEGARSRFPWITPKSHLLSILLANLVTLLSLTCKRSAVSLRLSFPWIKSDTA